mmetsp:Transcript_16139/g.46336  ORF Transcript_16139/g.46336 Transcript_16139/m.46336 type:complete len:116 (+) Transcript_16139:2264-2611(+)
MKYLVRSFDWVDRRWHLGYPPWVSSLLRLFLLTIFGKDWDWGSGERDGRRHMRLGVEASKVLIGRRERGGQAQYYRTPWSWDMFLSTNVVRARASGNGAPKRRERGIGMFEAARR